MDNSLAILIFPIPLGERMKVRGSLKTKHYQGHGPNHPSPCPLPMRGEGNIFFTGLINSELGKALLEQESFA